MPTDACKIFYDCEGCGTRLKPLAGDCCVFCSYASVPCPPIQENGKAACCSEQVQIERENTAAFSRTAASVKPPKL